MRNERQLRKHYASSRTIELAALHYALLVRDSGSFRKAAALLGVRTSVVSRKVRALEDAIGVSLFQRQRKGAQSTFAGQRFLDRGRTILSDIESLVRTAGRSGSGAEGRLCIGVVASIAGGTARELIKAFKSAHPEVELDIIEGSTNDGIAKIRALRMDIFLIVGTGPIAELDVLPLWSEPIHVALPEGHELCGFEVLQWDQLAKARFIVTKMDPGTEIQDFLIRHLADLGRRPVVEPRPVLREGLLALVGLGFGISLVGTAETAVNYPNVVFRPLAGEMLPFSAVWAPNNDNSALRRFLSLARGQAEGLLATPPRANGPDATS